MIDRRDFIGGAAAAAALPGAAQGAGARIRPLTGAAEIGRPLPPWEEGCFDIHFVATGMGENALYILPDGTTWLNDLGDYTIDRKDLPPTLAGSRTPAECVSRYLARVTGANRLDWLTISHWHTDHAGAPRRDVVTKDGRRVGGAAEIAEYCSVGRYTDFEWPASKKYNAGDVSFGMMRDAVDFAVRHRGLAVEAFRPGALDQIRPVRDPGGKWARLFHVRNLCANGVAWTGTGEETADYAAQYVKATGRTAIDVNILSMALRLSYGPFAFFTGGDLSKWLRDADGRPLNIETHVGRVCGPVDICKTNHHGYVDAMNRDFVAAVRPAAYVSCIWYYKQIADASMKIMASRDLYPGARYFFANGIPAKSRQLNAGCAWWSDFAPTGHTVVRVAPGGETYRIFTLDAADEKMLVTSVFAGRSGVV